MARKGWHEALVDALQKEDSAVMQLATIEPPNTPRVRSLIHRAFLTASTLPTLPLILSTTDIRTPKISQLNAQRTVEVVYWTPRTEEQFRILGRASVVPEVGFQGTYPAVPADGVVYAALAAEGFDWEATRVAVFDEMSGHMKATWCRPVPGTPLVGGEEEMKRWPETLPRVGEAANEEEERNLAVALSNFALLIVEPFEVDYVELGVVPNRRTTFARDWEEKGGSVAFEETRVVP